jgi:hypothetical protein
MTRLFQRLVMLETASARVGKTAHSFDSRSPSGLMIAPADQPPMFACMTAHDLGLMMAAIPLYRDGLMDQFTDQMRGAWARALEELKKNGHSLAEVPQLADQRRPV